MAMRTDRGSERQAWIAALIVVVLVIASLRLGVLELPVAPPGGVATADAQGISPLTRRTNPNRVGINNQNPVSTLDVTGNTKINGPASIGGTVTASAFRGDGSQLSNLPRSPWTTDGGNILFNDGKVGVGT